MALRWLQETLAERFQMPPYSGQVVTGRGSMPASAFSGGGNATVKCAVVAGTAAPSPSVLPAPAPTRQQSRQHAAAPSPGGGNNDPPISTNFSMNGAPKLLLVQRRTRSIGPMKEIFAAAQKIGYDVAFTYFEGLPMMSQYTLARHADVFLSIHGMALTWAFAMDGGITPETQGCRTVIELRHYVRPFPLKLQFAKHIASSANLSYVEIPATTCKFGRSVRNPKREYSRLFLASFVIGLKGFHDQVAYYNVTQVTEALQQAYNRSKACGVVNSARHPHELEQLSPLPSPMPT